VLDASPAVLNHNIETVPALYPTIRPQADYQRSLALLASAHEHGSPTKSGLMLGLGESIHEIREVMRDLRSIHCSFLTLGQYLQPSKKHLPVEKYYHPDEFVKLRDEARELGFQYVAAAPLVRSSYHAEQYW
jgi:lipoic acid synthetase